MKNLRSALLWIALIVLYALHQDLWLWNEPSFWLGLPAGLTYHVAYCLAAAALMSLIVRFAWPVELDDGSPAELDE